MIVSLSTLLQDALKHRYAIPAFNVNFLEQAMAVLDAAKETNSPVILQFSSGGLRYAPTWFVKAVIEAAKNSPQPVVIHRDHCHTFEEYQEAIQLGFQSIMMDGSLTPEGTPRSFEDNVRFTQKAVLQKPKHISIEGELGCLGALETGESGEEDGTQANVILSQDQLLTDPKEAQAFVEATGVDALAIAIGTSHGAYKFSSPPSDRTLDIARVDAISKAIPHTPLVLHGSSSIPQALCEKINTYGGHISKTYGVPLEAIQAAIQHGVCKVNIDSDLRLAATAAIREALEDSTNFDPRHYLHAAYHSMKAICIEKYTAFGCVNQAERFQHETITS